jgi:hypothetical protein
VKTPHKGNCYLLLNILDVFAACNEFASPVWTALFYVRKYILMCV